MSELEYEAKMQERLANRDKELDFLVERWEKTRLLEGINDLYQKKCVALLLENQRLFNEQQDDKGDHTHLKRISIPIVRRVYGTHLIAWEIVSVQPLLGPAGLIYYHDRVKDKVVDEDILAKTRKLKCALCYEAQYDGRWSPQDQLDREAQEVANYAQEISAEINREILTDLRNNAGTISSLEWSDADTLWQALGRLADAVEKKIGNRPNWFATSKAVAKVLRGSAKSWEPRYTEEEEAALPCNVHKTGVLNNGVDGVGIKLFEDSLFPTNFVLMGYKGEAKIEAGYFYTPYVPFSATPVVLDPESFCPRRGLMTRYGKKLLRDGAKWYARLMINNFPKEELPKPETLGQLLDQQELAKEANQ